MGLATRSELSGHTVPVLRKALRVLEAVARNPGEATPKSLAVTLRIPPTTCYRILQSFVAEGWLERQENGSFELSFHVAPFFRPLVQREQLIDSVREPLARLVRTSGLTAKITERRENKAVTIHTVNSPKTAAVASRSGLAVSLAVGSSGAMFLSACPDDEVHRILDAAPAKVWRFQDRADVLRRVREARREGVCLDRGSFQSNVHTLSAPIYNAGRKMVAAVTLLGLPGDFEREAFLALIGQLRHNLGGCVPLSLGHAPLTAGSHGCISPGTPILDVRT